MHPKKEAPMVPFTAHDLFHDRWLAVKAVSAILGVTLLHEMFVRGLLSTPSSPGLTHAMIYWTYVPMVAVICWLGADRIARASYYLSPRPEDDQVMNLADSLSRALSSEVRQARKIHKHMALSNWLLHVLAMPWVFTQLYVGHLDQGNLWYWITCVLGGLFAWSVITSVKYHNYMYRLVSLATRTSVDQPLEKMTLRGRGTRLDHA